MGFIDNLLQRSEPKEQSDTRNKLRDSMQRLRDGGFQTDEEAALQKEKKHEQNIEDTEQEHEERLNEANGAMEEIFTLASEYKPQEGGGLGVIGSFLLDGVPVTVQIREFRKNPVYSTGLEKSARIIVSTAERGAKESIDLIVSKYKDIPWRAATHSYEKGWRKSRDGKSDFYAQDVLESVPEVFQVRDLLRQAREQQEREVAK